MNIPDIPISVSITTMHVTDGKFETCCHLLNTKAPNQQVSNSVNKPDFDKVWDQITNLRILMQKACEPSAAFILVLRG